MKWMLAGAGGMLVLLVLGLFLAGEPVPPAEKKAARADPAPPAQTSRAETRNPVESKADPQPAADSKFAARAEEIRKLPPDAEREAAVRDLAREWALESPVDAERWAAGLTDAAERTRALTHVALAVAGGDPREAIDIVEWHGLGNGLAEGIAGQWAQKDFSAAEEWASELAAGDHREQVLERIYIERAAVDPEDAAMRVSGSMVPGEAQTEAAIAVLHRWLEADAPAAQQWIEQFPEGPLKERARAEARGFAAYHAPAN